MVRFIGLYKKKKLPVLVFRSILKYIKLDIRLSILEHFIAVVNSLLLIIVMITTKNFFDIVTNKEAKEDYKEILLYLVIMVLSIIFQQIFKALDNYIIGYVCYKNVGKQMVEFMEKLNKIDPINFENSSFLDEIESVKNFIEYESFGNFASNCLRIISNYSVFFISITIYLYNLSPILSIIVVISFLPALFGNIIGLKSFETLEKEIFTINRKYNYYKGAIVNQETFKETRVLGAYNYFKDLFIDNLILLNKKSWELDKKIFYSKIFLSFFSIVSFSLSAIILFSQTTNGNITIGAFISVFGVFSTIFSMSEDMIGTYIGETRSNILKIETYFKILDMEETKGDSYKLDLNKGISLKNVYFKYPKNDNYIINNINLSISRKETIAIVGENGAGKSTLVKLIIGLYKPSLGTVELAGVDTKKLNFKSLFKYTSAVFQNFMKYKISLSENVFISDTSEEENQNKINKILKEVNFSTNLNLDTVLSTEFDGVDLSGGEWQRLAIARGIYRTSDIIVLDEPTASIDPI